MRKMLVAALAALWLVHCGSSREVAPQKPVVSDLGAANTLVARATATPRVHAAGIDLDAGKRIARLPRSSAQPILFESVGVSFVAPAASAVVEGKTVSYAHGRGLSSVYFALPHGLETLVRTESPRAIEFALSLPEGAVARRIEDGQGGTVEVSAKGRTLLNVTADRGWDANDKEFAVRLELEGTRVAIRVPDGVAYPVVIDPMFSPTTSPLRLRRQHSATLLGTGEVLLAGGVGTSTAELFDAHTGRFHAATPMTKARASHAATLLGDGRVLLVGNADFSDSSAEIYDPKTSSFKSIGFTSKAYQAATLTSLADGKVIVTNGGSTADLYDPATDTFSAISGAFPGGPSVTLANGNALFVGGGLGANTVAVRDAATGALTTINGAPDGIWGCEGIALPDGRAWFAGVLARAEFPDGSFSYSMGAWLVDPVAKTFTVSPAPNGGSTQRLVLLPTGKVAIINEFGMQVFDPATNAYVSYTYPAGDPRKPPTMIDRHGDHTATMLPSGDVLVVGGDGASELMLAQDDVGSFDSASLDIMRVSAQASQLLDGRVLLSGGTDVPTTSSPEVRSTAEIFDPKTKTSGALVNMTVRRVNHAQVVLPSGKALIAGGASSTAELFDPATNTSTATGSLSVPRPYASAVVLPGGKALVVGGGSTAEIYDESTGTFGTPVAMLSAHTKQSLFRLENGKVLVFDAANSELFDPKTGTFSAAGSPVGSNRDPATAAMLANGNVMAIGGPSAAADLYDWQTGLFSLGNAPDERRDFRRSTPIPTGKVLVVGGFDALFGSSQRAYLFDPIGGANKGAFQLLYQVAPRATAHPMVSLSTGGAFTTDGNPCAPSCPVGPPSRAFLYQPYPSSAPRPVITAAPASVVAGSTVTITGTALVAALDSNPRSSTRSPIAIWVPASGQGQVMGTILSATTTSAKWRVPMTALYGKGWLHLATNGTLSTGFPVEITPAVNGTGCSNETQCSSGFCVDGVCCDTACVGACNACTKARKGSGEDGTCAPIPPDKDATDACSISPGAPCKSGAECASGFCADGVCCDGACTGQCEACNVPKSLGKCTPVVGAPAEGHLACDKGTDACAARSCDGTTRDSCAAFAPATTDCRAPSCADGVQTLAGKCDGSGKCEPAKTNKCEPFACAADSCLDKCSIDTDCTAGYRCAAGKCVTGAYCDGDHTVKNAGVPDVDCTPYRCEADHCRSNCTSSSDCLGGYICDNNICTAPAAAPTDSGGGCSYGGQATGGWILGLVVAFALRRRKA